MVRSTKSRFWSGRINLLVAFAVGAIWAAGVTDFRAWQYHSDAAAEQIAEQYNETAKQALLGHEQSVRALTEKLRLQEDMKKHPEKYRAEFKRTYHPSAEEQAMADFGGAKGEQGLATAYNGSLRVQNIADGFAGNPSLAAPQSAVSVSALGGTVTIEDVPSGPPIVEAYTDEPRVAADPPNPEWRGFYYIFRVTAACPGSSDSTDIAVWIADGTGMEVNELPVGIPIIYDSGLTVTWTIGLTDAFRRVRVTESYPSSQRLRHPGQRTGEGHWFADENTVTTVTASVAGQSLSASGNYGAGSETDLTESIALGLTCAISYNYAPVVDTSYASITAYLGSDDTVGVDFSGWTFYKDTDNSAWHWHGSGDEPPVAANIDWYTSASGSTISLRRGAHGSAAAAMSWSELGIANAVKVVPMLYKANKDAYGTSGGVGVERYTSYDTSEGHPFELNLYRQEGETAADVSVAPSWDGYTYVEFWAYGVPIPDRIWRKFTNMLNGVTCSLRADWMTANNEDVVFTLPSNTTNVPRVEDGITYPLVDILQVGTLHPLDGDLMASPWRTDWISWAREELNLDKPNGTNRPSEWEASVGALVEDDTWVIIGSGGTVLRELKSRRPNRIRRLNAHLWTGTGDQQEVKHEWLLMTRHDLPIEVTEDDPKWWNPAATPWTGDDPGILYEDVTDWRALSAVQLTVSGATEDQTVQLRLYNQHLTGSDMNYLGAQFNFGVGDGEFEATWSDIDIWTVDGQLDHTTGICKFDLAPNTGTAPPDLEYVSKVEFVFPVTSGAQTLTFVSFETVPAQGAGSSSMINRMSHLHKTDWFGGRQFVDGIWNYEPTYLYVADIERGEVGFKHTHHLQHPPTYEGPEDDPTYLKTLAEFANEAYWAETLIRPTWNQSTINNSLRDADGNTIAAPLFADMDESGYCLHIGTDKDVFFPCHVVYFECILQGSARGVLKAGGVRAGADQSVSLYYSDDNGATKTLVQTVSTNADGSYRVWAGREKDPRIFYLLIGGSYYRLGSFYNAEEVWHGNQIVTLCDLFLYINKYGMFYRVYEQSGSVKFRKSFGLVGVQSAQTVGSVSGNVVNVYAWNQGQKLLIGAQQEDGTEVLWVGDDDISFTEVT